MRCACALALLGLLTTLSAEAQDTPRSGLVAWDTGTPLSEPLSIEAKAGWTKAEPGAPKGDLLLANGRILAVARKSGTGLELYSLKSGKPVYRARLQPASGGPLETRTVTEAGRGAVVIELGWKGASSRFRIPRGETFVESEALGGEALRID